MELITDTWITDAERQLLVVLVIKAWVDIRQDPEMQTECRRAGEHPAQDQRRR